MTKADKNGAIALYKNYISFNTKLLEYEADNQKEIISGFFDTIMDIQDKFKEIADILGLLIWKNQYDEYVVKPFII